MPTQEMLQRLSEQHEGLCVTIYSPTYGAGSEATGNPTRLKSNLRNAEKILSDQNADRATIERILAPGMDFQAQIGPKDNKDGTLCLFLADGFEEILFSPTQIPEAQTFVSDRFHLKLLIPTLTQDVRFYILATSRHDVRLLQCTRYTQREEPLSSWNVPTHILEAVPDVVPKKTLQQRSARVTGGGERGGQREAMFHGHGKGERRDERRMQQFLREVNSGIVKHMDGHSPLVFAGVEELFYSYRDVNTYDYLLSTPVTGNPDRLRPEELREKAWAVLEPYLHERVAEVRANFEQAEAYGRATDDVKAIVLAARDGRVGAFFGATDCEYWGRVPDTGDEVQMRAEPRKGDYDLIDYAAITSMLQKGHAYLMEADEVPGEGKGAAAILRY